ncbi:MAG: YdcF family protein [Clostridia bacterium]|nr:YdcF family protein [Clostridia bacterium]
MKNSSANNKKQIIAAAALFVCAALCLAVFAACVFNIAVIQGAKGGFVSFEEASGGGYDCILVLGAKVNADGTLSQYLQSRVDAAAQLYYAGAAPKILVSGDHMSDDYDEPNAMKAALVAYGIPAEVIFTDHAGFNTYDTMYRAKEIFCVGKALVVTQDFHMSRSLYIAKALGLEAKGVCCDNIPVMTKRAYELRETAARAKYFLSAIFKPKPTYLGEKIPISGDASASDG